MAGEDRFVDRLRELLPADPRVAVGPGDDSAILRVEKGELAVTTDMLVEGVDFFPGEDPRRLGRRAVAVNLSDLAAMGARPEAFLLSVGFPADLGEDFPLDLARGALSRAGEFGAALVGGDLSRSPAVVVSVTLWGRAEKRPLLRSGARAGDLLFVSGWPGRAEAGRRLASGAISARALDPRLARELLAAYHDPEPQVALGLALARDGGATAAIDVSDGLGLDACRLARASGVRAVIETARIPISRALAQAAAAAGEDPVEWALSGGDDYELLFSAPAEAAERLEAGGLEWGAPVKSIGRLEHGEGAVAAGPLGERDLAASGWDHLAAKA
jgi:thiamine-monophosphate kinase